MLVHSSAGQRSGHSFSRSLDEDPSQNCSAGVVWNHDCLTVEEGGDALSLKLARVVVGRIDFFMDCGSGMSVSCLPCEHFCRAVPKMASLPHVNQTAREGEPYKREWFLSLHLNLNTFALSCCLELSKAHPLLKIRLDCT